MADARFHFIELALRALRGDPQAHDLARGELMDRLAHADPAATDDSLEVATARLERSRPRPARQAAILLGGLLVLLGILLPLLGGGTYEELKQLGPHYHFIGHSARLQKEFENRLTGGMSREERLFFLANTRYAEAVEVAEWQQSFDRELPGDPAWLEEAILTSESPDPRLQERLVQIGASLEPDNGFWDLLEGFRSKRNTPFLEALAKPRIESHIPARTKRRLEMLGSPHTLAEQVEQNHFVFRQRSWPDLAVGRSMVVHGSQARSPEDWRKTMDMWAVFGFDLPSWGAAGSEYQKFKGLRGVALMLEGDARARGLASEEARMKRMLKILSSVPAISSGSFGMRSMPAGPPVPAAGFRTQAASITRNAADNALPGTFTAEEFTPGRLAEHSVFDRYMALLGAAIFALFALLAAVEGWRRLPARRGLAAGLIPLFKSVDVAWLGGLGILLPLVWHIGITRFTPLGCRHIGLMEWDMMPGLQQAGGSLLFSVCMLQQTLRWRLAKRMGLIGLRPPKLWTGWAVAAVAALFVPAIGLVILVPRQQEIFLVLGSSMAGIPLLWVIWRAGMTALQPQEAALEGVLLSRLLVPAYTVAAGVLLLAVAPLQKEERRWVAQDTLGGPATDGSLMQAIDARAIAGIRMALREAWEGR
jgi:hypothetical protein